MSRKPKVLVAMSGGVDSSVAALLLTESGYDVYGASLYLWPGHRESSCPRPVAGGPGRYPESVDRARSVADRLGIPFRVLDYTHLFERTVIDPFCEEYVSGKTPNPCVVCNREIKFGKLLDTADRLGMDYLATGHYARVERRGETGQYMLLRGADAKKDQSYVLSCLTQEKLRRVLFPVGNLSKQEVRRIAERLDLKPGDIPESQEICFVAGHDYRRFVAERVPPAIEPGPVVDIDGKKLGEHRGIAFYTVGQRKGLGIAFREPLYVVCIDAEHNAIVLGPSAATYTSTLCVENVTWTAEAPAGDHTDVAVQIRYMHPAAPARIRLADNREVNVEFDKPQRAVTPGQTAAFYRDDVVLGGGIIKLQVPKKSSCRD